MEIYIKRTIYAILTIATFITIFVFSSQNATKSSQTSMGFTEKIMDILQIGKNWDENTRMEIIEKSQTIIRKIAHFTIYTIAGIWMMAFANTYDNVELKKKLLVVIIIGMLYAVSDEFHQMFSDGRAPLVKDVIIDTTGVLFGSGVDIIIKNIKQIKSKKMVIL